MQFRRLNINDIIDALDLPRRLAWEFMTPGKELVITVADDGHVQWGIRDIETQAPIDKPPEFDPSTLPHVKWPKLSLKTVKPR